jgi:hypothetical protein
LIIPQENYLSLNSIKELKKLQYKRLEKILYAVLPLINGNNNLQLQNAFLRIGINFGNTQYLTLPGYTIEECVRHVVEELLAELCNQEIATYIAHHNAL